MRRPPKTRIGLGIVLALCGASPFADAATPKQLEAEVRALRAELDEFKKRQEELQKQQDSYRLQQEDFYFNSAEGGGAVRSFLADRLALGGFFETAMMSMHGEDTPTQVAATHHTLGLNFAATFSSQLKFVSQLLTGLTIATQNPHNDPATATLGGPSRRQFKGYVFGALPAQAYVEYFSSDALRIQVGLGYVPFGHALQQRELVLFVRRGGPQLMRSQNLVEALWSGFHLSGLVSAGQGRAGYNLYTFQFATDQRMSGVGGRTWWESPLDLLTVGVSAQTGKSQQGGATTLGMDLRLRFRGVSILSEYAQRFTRVGDPWNVYLEPSIPLSRDILVFVFGDYAESTLNETTVGTTSLADPWRKLEYGLGTNWLPTAFTRFRLALTQFDYVGRSGVIAGQNRDYQSVDVSAAVAF